MNKKQLLALIAKKNTAKETLRTKIEGCEDVKELRTMQTEWNSLNDEIRELQAMADAIPDEPAAPAAPATPPAAGTEGEGEQRGQAKPPAAQPQGGLNPMGTYTVVQSAEAEARAKALADSEKRGKDLMEKRSVTVGSSNIVVPAHAASDIRPGFNEVSSLIDRVNVKPLPGGESYKQGYIAGYGEGAEKTEGQDYADAEPTFGYADINKSKVTAYAEDTEELLKLPAADYDSIVMAGIRIASRKRLTRQILVGTGAANRLVGIFSDQATAIDAATDIDFAEIDETTLDDIVYSYGGDEEVEDAAVLILNKKDLAAFAKLRTADGKKIHDIKANGNTGTIDGYPFLINSACGAISDAATLSDVYCMAYGPLSNYTLAVFSDMDVQRSTDYKFKAGMIAHRGSIFVGGNVTSKNGFLRVKKS